MSIYESVQAAMHGQVPDTGGFARAPCGEFADKAPPTNTTGARAL
jgi:hypothetical protein